jgi:ATP-binding cassette subfamily F protein 3
VQKSIVQHASNNAAPKSIVIHSICLPTTPKALDFSLSPISLARGNHVRIRGPNGVGKTTLLEAIVNNKAIGIELNPGIQIGYYRQDFHNLDHEKTVLECLLEASKQKHHEGHVRKVASQFNLRSELINQEVRCLSEGQKGLLSMACLVLQEPGLLILDEPTNHINFRHLPVIADALNEYEGTLLIVSHDQDFMEKLRIDLEIDLGNLDNGVVTTSEEAVQAATNRRAKVRP